MTYLDEIVHRYSPFSRVKVLALAALVGIWFLLMTTHCGAQAISPHAKNEFVASDKTEKIWMAASDSQLDELRGGFDFGQGLLVSFGITRAVFINGELISSTTFQLGDLSKLSIPQISSLSQQLGVSVASIQPASIQPSTSAQSTTTAQAATTSQTQSQAQSPAIAQSSTTQVTTGTQTTTIQTSQSVLPAAVQAQLVQNGAGNSVAASALAVPLATYIQNTLNNQIIRNQTVIQATTNGLSLVKNLNLQSTLNDALTNATGRR